MAPSIGSETLAGAWEASLELFAQPEVNRYNSRGEPCVEVEDLQIQIAHPDREPRVSPCFPKEFAPFVDSFTDRLLSAHNGRSAIINERLFRWPTRSGEPLDQLKAEVALLSEERDTRHGVIGFWDPELDMNSPTPVGPLLAYFRIRDERVNSTVIARSLDAMTGAMQLMVGFANLQRYIAGQTSAEVGEMTLYALSYHLHDMDFPRVLDILRER